MSYVLAQLCSPKKKNERTNSELQTLNGPCLARIRNQTTVRPRSVVLERAIPGLELFLRSTNL